MSQVVLFFSVLELQQSDINVNLFHWLACLFVENGSKKSSVFSCMKWYQTAGHKKNVLLLLLLVG